MANVKISQLPVATKTYQDDQFMIIQNTSNKKLTLQTLLSKLDSPVVINSQLANLNVTINGTQPNLFYTNASTNSVGILTNSPENAALHILGDVRVGGSSSVDRTILSVAVGANDSGGSGYKSITINTVVAEGSITGIFNANDAILISGINITELNGYKVIGNDSDYSFKFNVLNGVSTSGLNTTPVNAHAQKVTFKPGVYKSSIEQVLHDSSSGTKTVGASYSVTGVTINGPSSFELSLTGSVGQEKYIYLKAITNSGDKATFNNVNGAGFNRIQLTKVGDAVTLTYDGDKWVCLGVNGASVSTV